MKARPMPKSRRIHLIIRSLAVLSVSAGFAYPAGTQAQQPVCKDYEPHVVGVVIDAETEAPLAGAYVSVAASDWGALTTGNGRFMLCEIGADTHLLTAERLGYQTLTTQLEATPSGDPVRISMQPDPILLEGLEIVTDRFERRRRAVATSVRSYDENVLASSTQWSVADFIDSRPGIVTAPCGIERCVYSRGAMVRPRVYFDEFPLIGGWLELETIPTSQVFMLEVYGRGRHIRAYSHAFMERAAKIRLLPVPIWY